MACVRCGTLQGKKMSEGGWNVIPRERTCGWCFWSERWTNKDRKMRSKCADCGTINYCDNRCRRKHLEIHAPICRMIIERKGRGKELDKLFDQALMMMKDLREYDLYKLIKKHPDLLNWTVASHNGLGLLHYAVQWSKVSILDMLLLPLHVNENLKLIDGQKQTPLMTACHLGHIECISVLLGTNTRTNVNAADHAGYTALHVATQENRTACISSLIDAGAHLDAVAAGGFTALHVASREDIASCIPLLINAGADVNIVSDGGLSALHVASQHNSASCIPLLINSGVHVDAKTNDGFTSLHIASQHNSKACIPLLINAGAHVNALNRKRHAALHIASKEDNNDCIPLLIRAGADVNIVTDDGFTSLHIASQYNSPSCIPLLINSGIDVNTVADKGITALHMASYHGSFESVSLLLANGADTTMVTTDGKTALDCAKEARNVNIAIVNLLTENTIIY